MEDLLAEQDENLASYKHSCKRRERIFAEKRGTPPGQGPETASAIRALQEKMALELRSAKKTASTAAAALGIP